MYADEKPKSDDQSQIPNLGCVCMYVRAYISSSIQPQSRLSETPCNLKQQNLHLFSTALKINIAPTTIMKMRFWMRTNRIFLKFL